MKKQTLRMMGAGFLAAAVITMVFALLQGHVPVSGNTVGSIFNSVDQEEFNQLKQQNDKLTKEIEKLEKNRNDLNAEIVALREKNKNAQNQPTQNENNTSQTTSTQEEASENIQYENTHAFTIDPGETADEIAQQLESNGIIDSADELYQLIEEWQLESVMQSGTFELSPDMSLDEIANIITGGAYYYN